MSVALLLTSVGHSLAKVVVERLAFLLSNWETPDSTPAP
jgi:hypothetical protein